jgi:hypothetical protein
VHNQKIAYTTSICDTKAKKHLFPSKPQISSTPGASPKQRDRYRVLLGEQVLGDNLTLDEALSIAKGEGTLMRSPSSEESLPFAYAD